ncbi:S9 family peptidase [Achromobacter xylosoxidans]|uniref:S9 family peptidase n=4 Tax=Alcaligenaceae TaxID=506 RepID=A0A9W5EVA9_ALCXX|nr:MULTISPECIES: S9 family peptidase [Achromobacter]AHC46603.1 putative peptidase [Achromobacter xylosoxidans NBRC 15126 = ATCC 27061]AUZ19952.1 S9 family peptidase [Achromobacter xylosoxidans]AXA76816.1 S9 family peptidase [Achromobacter xylosoxidans]EFV85108.1 peptidase [Achromobacter xylosoxidans C54]KOQ18203.1 peptidase [Achromobacter xylosoxidans]
MLSFMKHTILAAGIVGASLGASAAAQPPRAYPLKDFFRNPERGFFRLADDGKTLGFMQPTSVDGKPPRMNIYVQPLEGSKPVGEPRKLTSESARDISNFFWKGADVVLYQKDFGGDENFHVLAVDAKTGKVTDLTPYDGVRASIEDDLEDDPDHILISHNQRDPQVFDVYRVNVHTGAGVLVAQNPGNIVGWQTDHAGKVRAAVTSDGLNTTLLYRDDEASEFRPLFTTDYRTSVSPAFFTFDDKKFYALSNRGRDKLALVVIDPASPDKEDEIFTPDTVDLDAAGFSRKRRVLTVASYQTDKPQYKFFDAETETLFKKLSAQLEGYQFAIQGANRDEDKFIVAAYNDRTPGSRYIYDARADTLSKLADINPAIPEADMSRVQPISYQSRDGLTIHGYLTLPAGRDPKNLACIVNPHGGPWARDGWGYNPEVQFLANRGFCVLQMNFRGSTGYGRAFWEASFGQWGLKMQDDITDGVQWLVKQGIADPKRIGIYGASYGGYATLAGVTFTPDLYAAAVDYVGVSNLFTFMKSIPPYWKPMLDKMQDMVGDPVRDKDRLAATSPALHADRIKTPLFIAQGAKDPRVNKDESDQMVKALKARGVEVEYMVKDNEGHGFHNDENKFEFYAAMEKFFIEHLKP